MGSQGSLGTYNSWIYQRILQSNTKNYLLWDVNPAIVIPIMLV